MNEFRFEIEEVTDPAEVARSLTLDERHARNTDWLEGHWADLMPQARGKFVAVAGEESHIADTLEAGRAWIARTHPEDHGAFVRYVRKQEGPRIHANHRCVAAV
jgi:hypothetical protein